jgi:hypothetical protein
VIRADFDRPFFQHREEDDMSVARSERIAELERVVRDLEHRLTLLSRRVSSDAPRAVDRVGEAVASALGEIADRFRGRARAVGKDATAFSEEALEFGNDALRKLTREVEQRPLVVLAVALAVGGLAALVFARRR